MLANTDTAQEKRQVSILEIVRIERHVPKSVTRFRYPDRKLLDLPTMARASVAKGCLITSKFLHITLPGPTFWGQEVFSRLSGSRHADLCRLLALARLVLIFFVLFLLLLADIGDVLNDNHPREHAGPAYVQADLNRYAAAG